MMKHAFLIGAIAVAAAAPAAAEVVSTGEDSFVTQDTARVAATPRQTWMALIKPGDWWNDSHTWSADASNMTLVPTAGGCFCEKIPGEGDIPLDGSAQHALVVQAVPDKALRLRGELGPLQAVPATGVLTVTLTEIDGGTQIGWEYHVGSVTGFDIDVIAGAVDGVMTQQLRGLRDHLGALDGEDEEQEPAKEPEESAEEAPEEEDGPAEED